MCRVLAELLVQLKQQAESAIFLVPFIAWIGDHVVDRVPRQVYLTYQEAILLALYMLFMVILSWREWPLLCRLRTPASAPWTR